MTQPRLLLDADRYERDYVSNNTQTSSLVRGQNVVTVDKNTPYNVLNIDGRTLVNLLGRDGNCEDISKWIAGGVGTIALDTANAVYGTNSLKLTQTANGQMVADSRDIISLLNSSKSYLIAGDIKSGNIAGGVTVGMNNTGGAQPAIPSNYVIGNGISYYMLDSANLTGMTGFKIRIATHTSALNGQIGYADGVRVYEIAASEKAYIASLSVANAQAYIATKYPYVDDVKPINAPYVIKYGENLLPTFNEWTLDSSFSTVTSPYSLTYNVSAVNQGGYVSIPVSRNTDYYLSFSQTNGGQMAVFNADATLNIVNYSLTGFTFNSGSNDAIRVYYSNRSVINTNITFTNPMLNLGTTAKGFKQRNDDYLFLPNTYLHSSMDGTICDQAFKRDGKWWKLNRFKQMDLDGSLAWVFSTDYAGFKAIAVPISNYVTNSGLVVKYDGKILSYVAAGVNPTSGDTQTLEAQGNGKLYLSIADTDSGWGETYTPTAGELQAYFYNYRMNNGTFGTPYNGTGTKTWILMNAINNTGSVTVLPTTPASGYTPYKLTYQLATSTVEEIAVEGSIALNEGGNQFEVSNGMIVREKANIYANATNAYVNADTAGFRLKNRTNRILSIYKNGRIDNKFTILYVADGDISIPNRGKGYASALLADYDPTATYEVTYLALDQYLLSSSVQSINGEYNMNIKTTQDSIVTNQADLETRIGALENSAVRKDSNGITTAQSNTSYTTKQVRNITLSTADPSGGNNGDVWIKYTP